jgi:hypothetical protein
MRRAECGIQESLRDSFFENELMHTIEKAAPKALINSPFRIPNSALGTEYK